jgi:prepilin-type processing-associated H-X9-DG protein
MTGVCYPRSMTKLTDISDGTSNVYFAGEKSMLPKHYETGQQPNDDQTMYSGYDWDNVRYADVTHTLRPDYRLKDSATDTYVKHCFGGAHPSSCHFVFCDGSVHGMTYETDPLVHARLANICDGKVVDKQDVSH